jgi:hypothetical protein
MLRLVFYTAILFSVSFTHAQFPPTIVSTQVLPEYPSEIDTIYFVGHVLTSNYPTYIFGFDVVDLGDTIVISACYGDGVFNSTGERVDTFNLGIKPAGYYEILYNVHFSYWPDTDSCNYSDSNFVISSFDVGYASIEKSIPNNFKIYPNPTNGGILKIDLEGEFDYSITNYLGEILKVGRMETGEIDVSELKGQFILIIQNQSFSARRKIQINTP